MDSDVFDALMPADDPASTQATLDLEEQQSSVELEIKLAKMIKASVSQAT